MTMQLLCFELADKEYAVGVAGVREVRRVRQVTPVPKAPDFVAGVINLRGRVVPVISLRKKLGLPPAPGAAFNRVLITELAGHLLGIAVDSVAGVLTLDGSAIEPPDELFKKCEYLTGVGKAGRRLILLVDLERLLSGEEKAGLVELREKAEIQIKA